MKNKKDKPENKISFDLFHNIEEFCLEIGIPEPGVYLAKLMAGEDPRPKIDPLWDLINKVAHRLDDDMPTREEWLEIVAYVLNDDRYQRGFVPSEVSFKAAEKLMEYIHAKKKAVELTGNIRASVAVSHPLTKEEIEEFEEFFTSEF